MKLFLGAAVIGAAVLLAVAVLATRATSSGAAAGDWIGSRAPGRFPLPAFRLADLSTGRLFDSRRLEGRVAIVTFLDSQCTDSCPIIAAEVAAAVDGLTPGERQQVVALAVSTDPDEDTRASVREFLRQRRALGRLRYLSGERRALRALWARFQILSSWETGRDALHSAPVRIYGRDGLWLATQHAGVDLTPENLVHDVRLALERSR